MFAVLRSLAALAAQIRAALKLRSIAEAADAHWAEATKRCAADRLADKEAETEVAEPAETSSVDGEAATVAGPPTEDGPASSRPQPDDDAGPPALTREDLHGAAFAARRFASEMTYIPADRVLWMERAARLQNAADAIK